VRVLLDESLPRRLARLLPGHDVRTVEAMGWATNRIESLHFLVPALLRTLDALVPRQLVRVSVTSP